MWSSLKCTLSNNKRPLTLPSINNLPGTNTLAYFTATVMRKKGFKNNTIFTSILTSVFNAVA
jgi:hypothetical protein